jgi:polyisoprenoid-binding protein YceI
MTQSPVSSPEIMHPPAGRYQIDPAHSTVTFTTRHLFGLGGVHGTLALRDGRIYVADPVTESVVQARVAAASFHSGSEIRDVAVLSSRLLDAEAYPTLAFISTELVAAGTDWLLRGELEVRGTARLVEARLVTVSADGTVLRATAQLTVDRYEFGLTAYRGLAARRLAVDLDILAVKEGS